MNLDFNAITAAATVIAVFVAIYAVWVEQRRSRFSQGVELLLRMSDKFFYSKEFIQNRRKAARFLKKKKVKAFSKKKAKYNHKSDLVSSVELDAILDFFQGMAMLVYKGAIDKYLVWSYFSWCLDCYYAVSQNYIESWRDGVPNTWDDVDWLQKQMIKIENKENAQGYSNPSPDSLLIFIDDELNLK